MESCHEHVCLFSELVIFYNTRNLHKKALLLLQKYSKEPDSDIAGNQRIIAYLQASRHILFLTPVLAS
jgi:hypothetical protein